MTIQERIFAQLSKNSKKKLSKQKKVDLSLADDINADLNTVVESLDSIRPALQEIEQLVGRNAQVLKDVESAINKVTAIAEEIGADDILSQMDDSFNLANELNITVGNLLSNIGNAISDL